MTRNNLDPLSRIEYEIDSSGCYNVIYRKMNRDGYPYMKIDGKTQLISRYVWQRLNGPIPEGGVIRHICDNRACINPRHLLLGTHADNVKDRVDRDRSASGSHHGRAKLNEDDVRVILSSQLSNAQLADAFDVDRKVIYDIRHGKTWKKLSQPVILGSLLFALQQLFRQRFAEDFQLQKPLTWQDVFGRAVLNYEDQTAEIVIPAFDLSKNE